MYFISISDFIVIWGIGGVLVLFLFNYLNKKDKFKYSNINELMTDVIVALTGSWIILIGFLANKLYNKI